MRYRHLALLLLLAAPLSAQTVRDTTAQRAVRVVTDSIRAETCRGGRLSSTGLTCSGATASPRVTVVRRLANRADSIMAALVASATAPPPVTAPVARITASAYPDSVVLYGTSSTASTGSTITSYAWQPLVSGRNAKTGARIVYVWLGDAPNTFAIRLTITDAAGQSASHDTTITIPPKAALYDSTASVQVLLSQPNAIVGDMVIVCGVFTTRSGAKGLLLFNSDSISNQSSVATLAPATSATQCLPLLQAAGIVLTSSLAPRTARWTVRQP